MSKFCAKCGQELTEEDKFCGNCGYNTVAGEENTETEDLSINLNEQQTTINENKTDSKAKIFKIISGVLVALAILVGGINMFEGGNQIQETIKAETLIDDYIRNEESAQKKYKDKKIQISGRVLNKGQFKNSSNFFVAIGGKQAIGKDYTVVIDYNNKAVEKFNKINYGDFLVVEGKCIGTVKQSEPTSVSIQVEVRK